MQMVMVHAEYQMSEKNCFGQHNRCMEIFTVILEF